MLLFISCNKQYDPGHDPLSVPISYLTGKNGSYSRWTIQSMYINEQPQLLGGSSGSRYYKAYLQNGTYLDGDGLRGKWALVRNDSLREIITNTISGSFAVQQYRILQLTDTILSLSYNQGNNKIRLKFRAEK